MEFKFGKEWFRKVETKPEKYFVEGQEVMSGKEFPLTHGEITRSVKTWEVRNFLYTVEKKDGEERKS